MIRLRRFGLLMIVALVPVACSSGSGASTVAPVAAQLSVERFLQAANQRDFASMGRLLGPSTARS